MVIPTIAAAQSAFHNVFILLTPFLSFPFSLKTFAVGSVFTLRGEGSSLAACTQFLQSDHGVDAEPCERLGREPRGFGLIREFIEHLRVGTGRQIGGHDARECAFHGPEAVFAAR